MEMFVNASEWEGHCEVRADHFSLKELGCPAVNEGQVTLWVVIALWSVFRFTETHQMLHELTILPSETFVKFRFVRPEILWSQ